MSTEKYDVMCGRLTTKVIHLGHSSLRSLFMVKVFGVILVVQVILLRKKQKDDYEDLFAENQIAVKKNS